MADPSSSEFFEQCRDAARAALQASRAVEGGERSGPEEDARGESTERDHRNVLGGYAHGYGLKITIGTGERVKEHYEAQLVRGERAGSIVLEIGFHSEYPKAERNDAVLALLAAHEKKWRKALGSEPVAGPFLGNDRWRRVSETWEQFDFRDPDLVFEVADRLADYVNAFEPILKR